MKRFIFAIFTFLIAGCATVANQPAPDSLNGIYDEQIREWQRRIQREGWTADLVDHMMIELVQLSEYEVEIDDHWDTPKEFMERGFTGDCEDIAVFMMATLKRLQYPETVRILAVRTAIEDHALLKVKLPTGDWKIYETVPVSLHTAERPFYTPIVEFDEKDIIHYGS